MPFVVASSRDNYILLVSQVKRERRDFQYCPTTPHMTCLISQSRNNVVTRTHQNAELMFVLSPAPLAINWPL